MPSTLPGSNASPLRDRQRKTKMCIHQSSTTYTCGLHIHRLTRRRCLCPSSSNRPCTARVVEQRERRREVCSTCAGCGNGLALRMQSIGHEEWMAAVGTGRRWRVVRGVGRCESESVNDVGSMRFEGKDESGLSVWREGRGIAFVAFVLCREEW
ncbi:hypothetical protein BDY17DRAFT_89225 [Neohortaea acidophila]|uniref:Uncharacterized protein n=1 Tax=Neohortaea acidophila TaxID=245834 RepID=A0A6A6Q4N5_9PEZI|nr:uncharacterized protein BDY17DRAFT_89225 [Neohortaea acidophila]KAF2486926.1 hypothetical protein BDY17DRAFT_89225 [Neohortaea acidophila]